jgi:tetratricopeptide (TPR) repeat protein
MRDGIDEETEHTPDETMAAYVAGTCSRLERSEVEEHCMRCSDCRAKLAIMLRVCFGKDTEEDQKRMRALIDPDQKVAAAARRQIDEIESEAWDAEKESEALSIPSSTQEDVPQELVIQHQNYRPFITYGAALALFIMLGLVGYWAFKPNRPIEDGLAALRLVHRNNRPFEARITGGFAYRPYERKRGKPEISEIDRDQFNYALAELTCVVAANPTPEARHALGRLCLLINDFEKAEKQFELALADEPNNAKLHADLATLSYERSKYSDKTAQLTNAIKHNDSAIRLDPQLAEAWFNRALCHEQLGNYQNARNDWERYLQLDPESSWVGEVRDHLKKIEEQ